MNNQLLNYNYNNNDYIIKRVIKKNSKSLTIKYILKRNTIFAFSSNFVKDSQILAPLNTLMPRMLKRIRNFDFTIFGKIYRVKHQISNRFKYMIDTFNNILYIYGKQDIFVLIERGLKDILRNYLLKKQDYYIDQLSRFDIKYITPSIAKLTASYGLYKHKFKSIILSLFCAMYEPSVIDSIVFHEHIHCLVLKHNKEFYDKLKLIDPNFFDSERKMKHKYHGIELLDIEFI